MTTKSVMLSARGIEKTFGVTRVLDHVDLELCAGRVDGLIGRNGAGKSTLVNVLTARIASDGGSVEIDGTALSLHRPSDALAAGIVAVPQEIIMPMGMSVAEVVTFGSEPGRFGVLSLRKEATQVQSLLTDMGIDIDITARVRDLPVSLQRVVLVAQALYRKARVLILDEPTAAMSIADAEHVMKVVKRVCERGVAVLYISHRFDEIERLCDRVTAMADGKVIDIMNGAEITQGRLVAAITGAEPTHTAVSRRTGSTAWGSSLDLRGVSGDRLRDVSLTVSRGEIVGVAGLAGSGVEEIFQISAGFSAAADGSVSLGPTSYSSVRQARRLGISLLPASRAQAVLSGEPVLDNLTLPALRRFGRFGWLTAASAWRQAAPIIDKLSLRPVVERRMDQLSGGNQQRVLVGAKLLAQPIFLLLEDPTVGVDVGARAELHLLLRQLADEGMGLLVGSSEPEELIGLCDRIVAVRRGQIAQQWPGHVVTEQQLLSAIT